MSGIINQAVNPSSPETLEPALRYASQLSETAHALDEIARSTCLLALNVAIAADQPAKLGKSLIEASRDVRQLASRSASTLADLEAMLQAVEKGDADVELAATAK